MLQHRSSGASSRFRVDRPALMNGTSSANVSRPANPASPCAFVIVVCGVSGCGKSTVGKGVADATGSAFYDADDFHPPSNVAKMAAGIPLTDEDRWPWLDALAALIQDHASRKARAVVACSALKATYRDRLRGEPPGSSSVAVVLLDPSAELLMARLQHRANHFMPATLLASQLQTLERPITSTFETAQEPGSGWKLTPGKHQLQSARGLCHSSDSSPQSEHDSMLLHITGDPSTGTFPSPDECVQLIAAALENTGRVSTRSL